MGGAGRGTGSQEALGPHSSLLYSQGTARAPAVS